MRALEDWASACAGGQEWLHGGASAWPKEIVYIRELWERLGKVHRGWRPEGLECQNEDFELYLLDYPQLLRCFEPAEMALQVGANCGRP